MRKLIDEFWYYSAVVFSRINPFLIRHFHVDKLGFFLRHLSQSRIIQVQGFSFHMDANISSCYPKLIGGKFNEEETHKFLQKVLQQFDSIDLFLDVGSNIGEFVVTVGASHKTRRVIGFEPNPLCVSSCLKSVRLNGLKNVTIIQKILTDSHEAVEFDVSGQNAHLHSVFDGAGGGSQTMYSSTLDDEVLEFTPFFGQ
jgi:FkbM family methyltransferase